MTGTTALTATDDEVSLDVSFHLVGPNAERFLDGPLTFVFQLEGATGSESLRSVTGRAQGVRFTRPAGPRPPAVRVTTSVELAGYEYPYLQVAPVVLVASEPFAAMATATPATVGPGQTAAVCVKAFASGQPVSAFDATFSIMGPGVLDALRVSAVTGEACVSYTAPAMAQSATVTFGARVEVNGATAEATTTVALTTSAVQVVVMGAASATVGATVPFTASVTGATNPAVTWTASGGTISPTGEFSATSSGSYVITATSVEDPSARGQATVLVSCAFPNTPLTGDNRDSLQTEARGLVLSSGQTVVSDVDTGTGSATIGPLIGSGYNVSASASATATSVTAQASTSASMPLMGDAQGVAESISRIATISGTGTGRVRLTATVQGSTGADGAAFATLEFDPFDDVGSDSVTFDRGVGTGPTSFSQQLVLETTFSYSTATSLYARLATNANYDGNITVTLTSASVTVDACQ